MSNRTLIELNHDYSGQIKDDPDGFLRWLNLLLNSLDPEAKNMLRGRYGVRVFGTRDHSDGFDVKWGSIVASEPGL